MSRTNRAWERWSEIDPYYGVFSSTEFRNGNLSSDSLSQFFATGEEHIERVFSNIRATIAPEFAPRSAVDFGCGTGRLTIPLAKRCENVFAIDIASAMLRETKKNCADSGLSNVQALDPVAAKPFLKNIDFVHSYIVLQHIPPHQGMANIDELVSTLSPRGFIALHVTYERSAHWLRKLEPISKSICEGAAG